MSDPGQFEISDYRPGALGVVCALQAEYYAREWQFCSKTFETKVSGEMSAFFKKYDPAKDLFKVAVQDGKILGSITIEGTCDTEAYLRGFIIVDEARGLGLGRRLLGLAMQFCRDRGYKTIYLWTFQGLAAARHLYDQAGFEQVDTRLGSGWGRQVEEQCLKLDL